MSNQANIQLNILERAADKKQVFGFLYVSEDKDGARVEDLAGATIAPRDLEDAAYEFVLNTRIMGDMHEGELSEPIKFGRLIESFMITPEKLAAMGITDGQAYKSAWWVGFQVDDDAVWDKIKNGERLDFSLRGIAEVFYEE